MNFGELGLPHESTYYRTSLTIRGFCLLHRKKILYFVICTIIIGIGTGLGASLIPIFKSKSKDSLEQNNKLNRNPEIQISSSTTKKPIQVPTGE